MRFSLLVLNTLTVSLELSKILDWHVGFEAFSYKAVAAFNAFPRAHHADDALRETLKTMSAVIVESASISIPLLGATLDEEGMITTTAVATSIKDALAALHTAVISHRRVVGNKLPTLPKPPKLTSYNVI